MVSGNRQLPRDFDQPELKSAYEATVGSAESLLWQARDVFQQLVLPNWASEKHGYDRILYGVVMNIMAIIDRLSHYPSSMPKQTERMNQVMIEIGASELAAKVSIQLWRHTLMHTGTPMAVNVDGRNYVWLLHWSEMHLPRDQHLKIQDGTEFNILNFSAITAVEDLCDFASTKFQEWTSCPTAVSEIIDTELSLRQRQKCK